jgi:hypothetical protein
VGPDSFWLPSVVVDTPLRVASMSRPWDWLVP